MLKPLERQRNPQSNRLGESLFTSSLGSCAAGKTSDIKWMAQCIELANHIEANLKCLQARLTSILLYDVESDDRRP